MTVVVVVEERHIRRPKAGKKENENQFSFGHRSDDGWLQRPQLSSVYYANSIGEKFFPHFTFV